MAACAAAPAAREAAPLEPCACAVLLQFDEPRQAQQINEQALRSALTSIGVRPRCVMSCAVAWLRGMCSAAGRLVAEARGPGAALRAQQRRGVCAAGGRLQLRLVLLPLCSG
jgi:hypothetical protein